MKTEQKNFIIKYHLTQYGLFFAKFVWTHFSYIAEPTK